MTNSRKRMMSFIMAFVLALSLCVPAFAASDYSVTVLDEGGDIIRDEGFAAGEVVDEVKLFTIGEQDIASIKITDSAGYEYTWLDSNYNGASDNLFVNTNYRIYEETDSNGIRTVYFDTTNGLNGDVEITVTPKDVWYQVVANSGVYNVDNEGDSSNATCSVSSSQQSIRGGDTWTVIFTPYEGQEITHLNIRPEHSNDTNLVAAESGNVTVAGRTYQITKAANGTVTLRCAKAACDIFATALTQAEKVRYTLTVNTDSHSSSDVKSTEIVQGDGKTVTLTPTSGYNIGEVTIRANGKTGTISYRDNSVSVDGKTYTLNRRLNGSAVLTVPAMASDVTVSVAATNNTHYVSVSTSRYADSDEEGVRFLRPYERFTITFEPRYGAIIEEIVVETTRGEYTADANDAYIIVEGTYYRIFNDSNGDVTLYLTDVPTNMEVSVRAKDTIHDVTVRTDNGCDTDRSSYDVDDGDALTLTFTPTKDRYNIDEIRVNYDGRTYEANPQKETYVRVDGMRWQMTRAYDGTVTLYMENIEHDVTVTANTDYTSHGNYRISKTVDAHSNVTFTGSNPFEYDDASTIRVYTDKNYVIKSVKFTMDGKSQTIEPFDTYFTLDGYTYRVDWDDNTEFSVYFDGFTGNLTINAKSERGDVEYPSYWDDDDDIHININGRYHNAYMFGYGNGYFGVNDSLTRAQAVVMLTRSVLGIDDSNAKSYSYSTHYADVPGTFWAAGQINYAASCGFLDVLTPYGGNFYPNQPITRAEYLALLCRFQGISVNGASTASRYYDVPASHWAARYINYATNRGWVQGYGNGSFGPDQAVTRAAMCVMTNHVLGREADHQHAYAMQFIDVPYGFWAYYDIMEASTSHYVISYDGNGEVWGSLY